MKARSVVMGLVVGLHGFFGCVSDANMPRNTGVRHLGVGLLISRLRVRFALGA